MRSDVKAIQITATGQVFGVSLLLFLGPVSRWLSRPDTGSITLQDISGTQFTAEVPPGDVFTFNMPEDGILFKSGMTCSAITSAKSTVLIDK